MVAVLVSIRNECDVLSFFPRRRQISVVVVLIHTRILHEKRVNTTFLSMKFTTRIL